MKQTVYNKIIRLKALSKAGVSSTVAKNLSRIKDDSLSMAIRSEKDAIIFRKELHAAFNLAKNPGK